jgi:two-component system, cell cycle response regulator
MVTLTANVVAFAGDAIVVMDDRGRIILFNRAAERLFGYSADMVLGRRFEVLTAKACRHTHRQRVSRLSDDIESANAVSRQRFEITGLRKGQVEFPLEVTWSRFVGDRQILIAVLREASAGTLGHPERREGAWLGVPARLSLVRCPIL